MRTVGHLAEFFNRYVRGHLEEEFVESYAVAPCRELGMPQRIGHVCTGSELLNHVKKHNLDREPRPVFASMVATDGTYYRALDRVCIDVDIGPEEEKLKMFLRELKPRLPKFKDYIWLEFTGYKGYRICIFLQELVDVGDAVTPIILRGYQKWLSEKLRVPQDPQTVGDLRRLFRVPFTINEKSGKVAVPIHPETLEKLGPSEALEIFLDRKPLWLGYRVLAYAEDVVVDKRPHVMRRVKRSAPADVEEVCLHNEALGRVCAPTSLVGHGWLRYLVDNGVYLQDARHTAIWTALGYAVASGIVSLEEAEAWLRAALERYPDPEGEPPESYLKMLRYFAQYRQRRAVPPPTWRTLATFRTRWGAEVAPWTKHLAVNVLYALHKAGVVKIEKPEVLEELWRSQAGGIPA
ncbi:hypothetical protein ODS41_04040 [Pyrobaculum sp. 3827-6]|uniref:hypothetical protein n=1 Tax=Pyrobaculum sp. 3827-6 TaxID=2983604 RepID=UPI0021DB5E07|nr:hypothetical protein [Pyrobaculum sp. 3827-6]MCU7787098.1 hypothetical protein [Pyrobaculum sp. 3827-6]